MDTPPRLQSLAFDIEGLASSHPPRWLYPHKQALHDRIRREGSALAGTLQYTRWNAIEPTGPLTLHPSEITAEPNFYTYPQSSRANTVWHVNFADPRLFAAYGSALLAQDELQVLEHPALGSLREALLDAELPALTRENGRSTPVLITGVPRQGCLNTAPPPAQKYAALRALARLALRHQSAASSGGLYGNQFQRASLEAVQAAFTVLNPPTITHLIAIAAPTGTGRSRYTHKQIVDILETAATAFQAAVHESRRLVPAPGTTIEIHTGWWGCGAFGGSRPLMALLQILAARLTGIHRLIFHTGSPAETPAFTEGHALLETLISESHETIADLIDAIEALGYTWGTSDGN